MTQVDPSLVARSEGLIAMSQANKAARPLRHVGAGMGASRSGTSEVVGGQRGGRPRPLGVFVGNHGFRVLHVHRDLLIEKMILFDGVL
jgi:hypothetical protein